MHALHVTDVLELPGLYLKQEVLALLAGARDLDQYVRPLWCAPQQWDSGVAVCVLEMAIEEDLRRGAHAVPPCPLIACQISI